MRQRQRRQQQQTAQRDRDRDRETESANPTGSEIDVPKRIMLFRELGRRGSLCALWLRGRGHRGSLAKSRAGSGLLLPAEQSMLAIPRLHSREKTPRGDFAKRFFLHEFSLHLSEPVLGKCCFLQRQLWKRGLFLTSTQRPRGVPTSK